MQISFLYKSRIPHSNARIEKYFNMLLVIMVSLTKMYALNGIDINKIIKKTHGAPLEVLLNLFPSLNNNNAFCITVLCQ